VGNATPIADRGPVSIDSAAGLAHLQGALAGETGLDSGAEGATAPETLRQKDRAGDWTLESSPLAGSPKEQGAGSRVGAGISQAQGQRGRVN
jgi:hypothetical protein